MINEKSIANSFRAVKGDIIKIQGELLNLKEQQAKILLNLENIISQIKTKHKKKVIKKRKWKKIL